MNSKYMAGSTDLHWDQLLDFIEAGTVVPVLGRELLQTEIRGERQNVYFYLASRLAQDLRVARPAVGNGDPVSDVVQRYLAFPGQNKAWPYTVVFKLVKELATIEPPPSLVKIAEIGFPLFVSTTFDGLLERAVKEVLPETESFTYFWNSDEDLPLDAKRTPIVFNLLGRATATPDFALTDADVIEFVRQFQNGRPQRLLDTLCKSHLLFIGNGFPDWLARFFLRMARPASIRLWVNAQAWTHYIADIKACDASLQSYLEHPLSTSCVFPTTDPNEFVNELHQRWKQRPSGPARNLGMFHIREAASKRGVFLSYATADLIAAQNVRNKLHKSGLDVWFDKQDLYAGDDWDRKIRAAIDNSLLFLPLISQRTLTNEPAKYFRSEWWHAEVRARLAPLDVPYVYPILIDRTTREWASAKVPEVFAKAQWTDALGGDVPEEFVILLKKAYRLLQRPEGGV